MSLTPAQAVVGKEMVEKLDAAGVNVDAALWLYSSDTEGWKLLLSMPDYAERGPRAAYRVIAKIMSDAQLLRYLSITDVVVMRPNAPLLGILRKMIITGPGIHQITFFQNVIDGVVIEQAYIYRILKAEAKT